MGWGGGGGGGGQLLMEIICSWSLILSFNSRPYREANRKSHKLLPSVKMAKSTGITIHIKCLCFRCAISTNTTQSNFETCQQVNGTTIPSQEVLEYYGIDQPFWHYFLPLFAFLIVFRVLGYLLLRFYQKPS